MVDAIYREAVRPRNSVYPTLIADPQRRCSTQPDRSWHPDLVDHPLVTPDDQLRLVAAVEDEGRIALGDLVARIPDHSAPISAVMVLVDAGVLALDHEAAFDAALQVSRPNPPLR